MTPASIAERALAVAQRVAGPKAEVRAEQRVNDEGNVRFARNAITTSGAGTTLQIGLAIKLGHRHAYTSTNQTDDASLHALAERAVAMAKLSPEDPEAMPLLPPQKYLAVPSAHDDAVAAMDASARAAVAARACAAGDAAKTWIAGFVERFASSRVIATSTGLTASHRSTSVGYTTTARTHDGTGSGWAGRESFTLADVDDAALSKVAIDKARLSASPKPLAPGKYTVILEPAAVMEMLEFLVGAMDQRDADEGRSYFTNKLGEKLFPESITLKSDPTSPETPHAPFDDEGFALAPQSWIDKGIVKQLQVSRFWGAKVGKAPTGGQSVFHLGGGAANGIDDLVRGTKRGLLVTRFWYTRMLEPQTVMLTGLTRDGVFLVEDGKVTQPVQNFRYNESPVNVLKNVEAMTRETFRYGAWRIPALRTRDFTMASVSAAV